MAIAEIDEIVGEFVSKASSASWHSLVSIGSAAGVGLMEGNIHSLDISNGLGQLRSAMQRVSLPTCRLTRADFTLQLKLPVLSRAIDKRVDEYPSVLRQGN